VSIVDRRRVRGAAGLVDGTLGPFRSLPAAGNEVSFRLTDHPPVPGMVFPGS
jgi:hypothetical protein